MDDSPSAIHDFLEDFLDTYAREKEFYATMSREVARKCELQLARSGIQASITSRVKEEESLKRKILQRNRRKRYKHAGDIREDIVDFAGVRIALYFPNHVQKTEELMREIFLVRGTVHHGDQDDYSEWDETDRPYIARFSGYKGTHLRVSIKEEGRKHSVGCTLAMVSEPAKPCGQTSIPSIQDGGPSGLDAVHELKRRCSQRVARQLSSPSPEACKKSRNTVPSTTVNDRCRSKVRGKAFFGRDRIPLWCPERTSHPPKRIILCTETKASESAKRRRCSTRSLGLSGAR